MADSILSPIIQLVLSARVRLFNPTRDWPAATVSRLEYDMRSHCLNGIPVGAPIAAAHPLGRADWFAGGAENPDLDYRPLGVQVECFDDVITSFRVILRPESRHSDRDRAFKAADLTLVAPNGSRSRLTGRTTEADLVAILGTPVETGPVAGDRVHTFVTAGNFIDSFHDPATGELLEISLGLSASEASAYEGQEPDEDSHRRVG